MGIENFANFSTELDKNLSQLENEIKSFIYQEFKNYIFENRLNQTPDVSKSFFTDAFCEFITYCYLQNLNQKVFNDENYNIISEYLENSKQKIANKNFTDIVIVSASKLSKMDLELNEFLDAMNNGLKTNFWIRNLDWYNDNHFLKKVKLSSDKDYYRQKVTELFKVFDNDFFNRITENKLISLSPTLVNDWNEFLEKKVARSLEKFIFTTINYNESEYEDRIKKIQGLFNKNTVFVFVNNVEIESKYKTTLLSDINLFSGIIKFDIPILTIDKNHFFSLLEPLKIKNFKNYKDLTNFLLGKNNENSEIPSSVEETSDTLNFGLDNWIENDVKTVEIDKIIDSKAKDNDLELTIDFNENFNFDENKNENIESKKEKKSLDFDDVVSEITLENNLVDVNFYNETKNEFIEYIDLFDQKIKYIQLTTNEYDKEKYLEFKNSINNKNIEELKYFLANKMNYLKDVLSNKKIKKQDAMNYYALYIKVKSCINEMEFLSFDYF